jgi:hypothetical protein
MSPHQVVAVAARLFAVWLVIHVPGQVYEFFSEQAKLHDSTLPFFALCVMVIEVIAILTLWLFPHTIARRLLGAPSAEPAPPASADTWLRIGCALIGLWLLATAVPALMLDAFALSYLTAAVDDSSSLRRSVFYYLAEVAIGVWLILGAQGFRKLVWWARNAGIGEPSNNRRRGP